MSNNQIKGLLEHGGWYTSFFSYIEHSIRFYDSAVDKDKELNTQAQIIREDISKRNKDMAEQEIESYIRYDLRESILEVDALCVACQLFSCIAIEGFLNYYGVRRFGEEFYKSNIERVSVHQKVSIIFAIAEQELISPKSDLISNVSRLFEKRNTLVHPKTKEVFWKGEYRLPINIDYIQEAKESIDIMISIFDDLKSFDELIKIEVPSLKD